MKRLAIMNGHETTATKRNGRWMIGGDFDTAGSVQIAAQDCWGTWGWYTLKGCRLKFDDVMTDEEIAKQDALAA